MNEHNTVEKMRRMRMNAMANLYHRSITEHLYQDYSLDDFLALMVDTEWENRQSRNIENLVQRAGFKQAVSAADIDYQTRRNLDKTTLERLLGLNFMHNKENLIITGPTGSGKSFLAQCIGVKACQMLSRTIYYNTARFFDLAKLARLEGTYAKLIKRIQKAQLLILDDFGLVTIDQAARNVLLDVIEERYDKASTIIATQIPVAKWHGLIGENTIADAILDRIVFSSHRIELEGESLRKKKQLN
ncbi:ATP-binding protein [Chitinophaga oryziterrae]|uniref:ATP-binding protein n=1 Tax=Chitinophaga oryziterrae TaxID=1031224 RepID=A0A6N8JJP2_9BACT|nr:IS21-like element helper ATPase IstB [Chitinophaga oryziterrae]MVT45214.1 ATP-binding protein [Chitinophaga oryziterrae]